MYHPIDFKDKLQLFSEHWSPKIIAQMNDYHFKLVKIQGEFVWHSHPETDEVFIVLDGSLEIHFRDGKIGLKSGEMFVVPKGVEHKPLCRQGVQRSVDRASRYHQHGRCRRRNDSAG